MDARGFYDNTQLFCRKNPDQTQCLLLTADYIIVNIAESGSGYERIKVLTSLYLLILINSKFKYKGIRAIIYWLRSAEK